MSTIPSISDVKREINFDHAAFGLSEMKFDAIIDEALGEAVTQVEEWLHGSLSTTTAEVEIHRPEGVPEYDLPLPERPVQSVDSVSIDTWRVPGDDVTDEDYIVHDTHLELTPDASRDKWPTDRRSITVSYTHGFDEVPNPVRSAIIRIVRHRLQRIDSDGVADEEIPGAGSVTYTEDVKMYRSIRGELMDYEAPTYYDGVMAL